ncbi:MAG: hypothetical protein SFV54_03105 [Bryobacteraceae bacterium]|nr:hypothetical protein [Bryobacteraceae bacterium]
MIARTLVLVPILAASTFAQYSHGYVFVAPGGSSFSTRSFGDTDATLHLGGGGEWVSRIGLGAGAELGYLAGTNSLGNGFGTASLTGSYHFLRRGKWDPFAAAGYTLGFRSGTLNMFHFGGGTNYWFSRRAGLKLEFRDHVFSPGPANVHFWGFRFGATFR